MTDWVANPGKEPRNKEALYWLRFACGHESLRPYSARQMRWSLTNNEWDITHIRRAA